MSPNASSAGALRLGILIGGGGRTALNIAEHIRRGRLSASIATIIAPRRGLIGAERLRQKGLPVATLETAADAPPGALDDEITRRLIDAGVELVCLAGYLRWLRVDEPFVNRVLNIHPALLPSFGGKGMYGMRVHRAVLEHGCKVSGCTVHVVDDVYDHGPIVIQKTCRVREDDDERSLAARVFRLERRAYPEAIALFAHDRVSVEGRVVRIRPGPSG